MGESPQAGRVKVIAGRDDEADVVLRALNGGRVGFSTVRITTRPNMHGKSSAQSQGWHSLGNWDRGNAQSSHDGAIQPGSSLGRGGVFATDL